MKKIREGSFPQKDAFVQYKQKKKKKARLSQAWNSTTLSWDLQQFAHTFSTEKPLVLVQK